jgi:hypothetical protein
LGDAVRWGAWLFPPVGLIARSLYQSRVATFPE